nr:PD-(D/E)XK nuclease family protein [uncultured Campylobacter sp.]
MDIEKFESMLKQIKVLSDKLEVKKLRGNNDYNLFLALFDTSDEVRLHSRFICSLLEPNSPHYQKELFLELFIKACGLDWAKFANRKSL